MQISLFDLFKIGIGPSSSHTVGPMIAARRFTERLDAAGLLATTARVVVTLYGSLALTGRGHGTDIAVLLGLAGEQPARVDPQAVPGLLATIRGDRRIALLGRHPIGFTEADDLLFRMAETRPEHANALTLAAYDAGGREVDQETYFSIGGGFVLAASDPAPGAVGATAPAGAAAPADLPYPFANADELLAIGRATGLDIPAIIFANEATRRTEVAIGAGLDQIAAAMEACLERGLAIEGELPGGLKVKRRAPGLHRGIMARARANDRSPHEILQWISIFAIAVNEENAAGGRVVTAPTNGAAGIIPAVLRYYRQFCVAAADGAEDPEAHAARIRTGVHRFLLAAGAVGMLCKRNASISGAEVGCQGEVGVAAAMAAAGLAAALHGSNAQIENAAEIALEHHLGMTCDPVGGLVQIPCIERNAMGAVKAINAASLALSGDGDHRVSLDQAIETMRQTGADMQSKYKETALGGLALNVVAC